MIISEQEKEQAQRILSRMRAAFAADLKSNTDEMKSLAEEIDGASGAVAISVWQSSCEKSNDISFSKWVHFYLVDAVMKAFKTPVGPEGIGVTPQIPDCLKDEIPPDRFKVYDQHAGMNNRQPRKPYDAS